MYEVLLSLQPLPLMQPRSHLRRSRRRPRPLWQPRALAPAPSPETEIKFGIWKQTYLFCIIEVNERSLFFAYLAVEPLVLLQRRLLVAGAGQLEVAAPADVAGIAK